jgi:hypothetical protein
MLVEFDEYRKDLTVATMLELGGYATINEIIEYVWDNSTDHRKVKLGWRFFVHLNKFPSKMKCVEDSGIRRVGKTNRKEKVWRVKNV